MLKYLKSTGKFENITISEGSIDEKVVNKEVSLAIIIPEDFSENIYNNKLESIKIVSIQGKEVTAWIENYTNLYLQNLSDISKASEGNKDKFEEIYEGYKNQALKLKSEKVKDKSLNKQLTQSGVGMLILFILLGATSTSNIILKEKRERTYQRICSTPVNSKIYVDGKCVGKFYNYNSSKFTCYICNEGNIKNKYVYANLSAIFSVIISWSCINRNRYDCGGIL
jgi:ABC-2 type transport system permease protein